MKQVLFISGIDTGIGKSYATGYLANLLQAQGKSVITQKLVQTGNTNLSEDIELHRRIMQLPLLQADLDRLTMPAIYSYPCSPHLAAEIDNRAIDLDHISACTAELATQYDVVLLEGAGGLMVPLTRTLLTIDYIAQCGYPTVLVTSGRLGSINHTLLSLEAMQHRNMDLHSVVYNTYDSAQDATIDSDTRAYIKDIIQKRFPETLFIELPVVETL